MTGEFYFRLSSTENVKLMTDIFTTSITTFQEFLEVVSTLDSKIPQGNYQVSINRTGTLLEWEHQANKYGGRFSLFLMSNILAFRTFCILAVEWLNNTLEFGTHIVGILVSIKNQYWNVQIWVDDGFDGRLLSERYEYLTRWLQSSANITNVDNYQIEYHVHPTYRIYNTPASEIRSQANQIAAFQTCIKQLIGGGPGGSQNCEPPPFNYEIATIHKRSRQERRKTKSYVDQVSSSGMF